MIALEPDPLQGLHVRTRDRARRQRSEQKRTSSQHARHFLRQANGR